MAKDYLAAFLRLFKTSSAQPCTFSTVKRPVGGRSAGVSGMVDVCEGGGESKMYAHLDVF